MRDDGMLSIMLLLQIRSQVSAAERLEVSVWII
jgi:hypothetical protein